MMKETLTAASRIANPAWLVSIILFFAVVVPVEMHAQSNLIANPGFESSVIGSWVNFSSPWFIWSSGNQGNNASSKYAFFGVGQDGSSNNPSANGTFYQTVNIPFNATSLILSYWLRITSDDTSGSNRDYLFVEIQNSSGALLYNVEYNTNAFSPKGSWVQRTLTLPNAHAGETIRIAFHGVSNSDALKTVFRVDDLALTATLAPPFAQTNSATNVTSSSATLNGSVNANGTSSSAYFEYGTTTAYGLNTSSYSVGSGSNIVDIQATPSALSPNSQYHYRVVATNTKGQTNRGSNVSFTTPPTSGNIHLQVNASNGSSLSASEMNAVLLFPGAGGPSVSRQQPPSTNPMDFSSVNHANYYLSVFCWDMLAAQSTVFNHSSSTNVTVTAQPKRPLSVITFHNDGSTVKEGLTVLIDSFNGETSLWTERSRGTTNSFGIFTSEAWPTTQTGEKYRVSVMNGNTQVGGDANVTVSNSTGGRTIGITTSVPLPNSPVITLTSPTSESSWPVGSTVPIRWIITGNTPAVTGIRLSIFKNGTLFQEIPMGNAASGRDWVVPSTFGASTGTIKVETVGVSATPQTVSFTTTSPQPNSPQAIITLPDHPGTPAELPLNVPIRFSGASSQGPPIFYYWYFSDGRFASGANLAEVTHTFKSNSTGSGWVKLVLNSPTSNFVTSIAFSLKGAGNNPNESKSLDPVNTATGAFLMGLDLMPVHGRGLPFLFQAYYNSLSYLPAVAATNAEETPPGALGYGWTHSFETRVQMSPDEDGVRVVMITFGDGHAEKYTLAPAQTEWQSQPGVWNKLSQKADGSFSLMTHSQLRHDFDQTNRLEAISDQFDNTLSVVWEDVPGVANARRIQKVVLPGGPVDGSETRAVLFTYRPATPTFLWKLEDPMHHTIEFTQDAAGDLISWINELNHTTGYTYDSLHQMLTGKDGKSHIFVKNDYNADRRVYRQEDPSQDVTLFSYDFPADAVADRITTIIRLAAPTYAANDPRNEETVDVHDAKLRRKEQRVRIADPDQHENIIWLTEKWSYNDATNEVTSHTNRRNFTTLFTRLNGNLTRVETPDGAIRTLDYTDPANPTLPTLITYPDARVKEKREYNAAGALITITFPFDPAQPLQIRRSFTVDAFGQVTLKTDANNVQQSTEFDAWGRPFRFTDGESKTSTFEFDDNGKRTALIDARMNRSETVFNAVGNLWKTLQDDPGNPGQQIVIEITYDENERAIQASDPLTHLTYSHRDEHGRVWKSEDHDHNATLHRFDALGHVVETENAKGGITRRTFNFAGYLLSESSPAPSTNVITYKRDANGNAIEVRDGDGVRTTFEYDSMDRTIVTRRWKSDTEFDETCASYNLMGQKEWDEDAGDSNGVKRKTFYHYDLAGNHVRTVTKGGAEHTFGYDFEGHLISATHASSTGDATRYQEYNGRYQLKKRIDENGHSEEFFYDGAGNLSGHVQESGSASPIETTFLHDSLNRLTRINPPTGPPINFVYDKASRRIEMHDPTGTTKWTYSTLDQVASIEMPNDLKLSFSYDPLGATQSITYPGSRTATYITDAAGRFQSVTDWSNRTISQIYTAGDRPLRIQFPNGVHTDLAHDPLGRLNVVTHQKGTDPALRHLSYGFNALGQVDSFPDFQLIEPESTYPCTYGKANELLTIAGSPVTHDGRGNLKMAKLSPASPVTDTLTWDYSNRLTSGSIGGAPFWNTFNGLGHRTATTRSGAITGFLHDDRHAMPRIMAETDAAGIPTAFYLYAWDTLLARILPDGSALWYHPDRQGNVVLLTDGSGSTAADYQYDAFGVPVSASGSFAASNHFRYLGGLGVWDNDDGTLHARARTYHSRLGGFLSKDPLFGSIQDGQSLNRYVYALGDPLGFSDPSGFAPVSGLIYLDTRTANSTAMFASGGGIDPRDLIPIYGSWRSAMAAANDGRYWSAAGHTTLAISDVFLIKSLGTLAVKVAVAKVGGLAAKSVGVLDNAAFAQKTFGEVFSSEGKFAGQTIDDISGALQSGAMKPADIPIEYIIRDGKTLILNTRSSQALQRAGIPRSQWNAVNMTGNIAAEARLTGQLLRNSLGSSGFPNPISSAQ